MVKKHIVYESCLDNRHVDCSCNNMDCKIGLNFDRDPHTMFSIDKYGNWHSMYLNVKNIDEIIDRLTGIKSELASNGKEE